MVWLKSKFGNWREALAAYNEGPYHNLRLKKTSQLSLGKGTYSMTIWMRWNVAKMAAQFKSYPGMITLAQVTDGN